MSRLRAITIFVALLSPQLTLTDPITLDLGHPSAFITSTSANAPPLPTGKSLALTKANNGDVDLYIGDGLVTDLGTALNSDCRNKNPECDSSIQQVLLSGSFGLQTRAIGLTVVLGGIVLAIMVAKVIDFFQNEDRIVPVHLNAVASEIASATANPTVTGIVFETASGVGGMQVSVINIPSAAATLTPNTATLTTGVIVSTATNSANGHNIGDYVFDFKDQTALTWLQNKAQSSTACNNNNKAKRDGFGCAPLAAMDAMAALEGPLANLLLIGPVQLPRFAANARNGDLARAVTAIFTTGRNLASLVNIHDPILWALAEMFLYFFDQALNHALAWAAEELILQSDLDGSVTSSTATTSAPCPTGSDQPACEDADCSGVNSVATCTVSGPNSQCSCAPLITPFINSVDVGWLFAQQTILSSLVSVANNQPAPNPTPSCYNGGPAHLDRDWAIGEVSLFCGEKFGKLVTPDTPISQNFAVGTQENFDTGVGQNTTFTVSWNQACNDTLGPQSYHVQVDECNRNLNSTIHDCDTTGPVDGKFGGTVTQVCVVFDNQPQTHPAAAAPTSVFCKTDADCTWKQCPVRPSTCDVHGPAPGVNSIGWK